MIKKPSTQNSVVKQILRKDLKEELESLEKKIDSKFDIKLDKLEKKIDSNARKYRDSVLNKLDEVMSELQTRRDERTIETHQYSEIVEQVDDHDKRIANLEDTKLPS